MPPARRRTRAGSALQRVVLSAFAWSLVACRCSAFALRGLVDGNLPPPVGAHYARELRLPVIGLQKLRLEICTASMARIRLDGAINLDEPILYRLDPSGALCFELSQSTKQMLRRMGVSLDSAEYEHTNDIAAVTINPPLIPPIRIALPRCRQT